VFRLVPRSSVYGSISPLCSDGKIIMDRELEDSELTDVFGISIRGNNLNHCVADIMMVYAVYVCDLSKSAFVGERATNVSIVGQMYPKWISLCPSPMCFISVYISINGYIFSVVQFIRNYPGYIKLLHFPQNVSKRSPFVSPYRVRPT
jgi:hypothetical protein